MVTPIGAAAVMIWYVPQNPSWPIPGGVIAEAIPRQDVAAKIGTVFQTILTGYRLLSENYPENVEVIEGEKFFPLL